jgi:hypothetical protein
MKKKEKYFVKILSGPSLVSGHLNWLLALEQDMVPKDVLEKYEKGEDINYNTAYGKGYITKEGHEKMKKYAINIDEPIEVLMNDSFPTITLEYNHLIFPKFNRFTALSESFMLSKMRKWIWKNLRPFLKMLQL